MDNTNKKHKKSDSVISKVEEPAIQYRIENLYKY